MNAFVSFDVATEHVDDLFDRFRHNIQHSILSVISTDRMLTGNGI